MAKRLTIILLAFFLLVYFSHAQKNATRPKIGLVLSGGGAKGFAHIGILKALEKEGIRPDYITGTSMGSIVGGLYALGYSADELETIVRKTDWDQILSNNIPFTYISYEEKEYYTRYILELFLENGSLSLPSGLIEGQIMSETLSRYSWPAAQYKTFDDFPIPFRCIATDASTGKEIVFKEGSLAEAMRASMAIPTAFTAAILDSTKAVDGGILNNFPVEKVMEMGADIVIGVNVSGGFLEASDLGSMVDILVQISMIPSLDRLNGQIQLCDIYIEPDMQGNTTSSFGNVNEILEIGNSTGENHTDQFRALAQKIGVTSKKYKGIGLKVKPVIISQIELEGLSYTSKQLVFSKFGYEKGDTVSRSDIESGIQRIFGINSFNKVIYHLENEKNDHVIFKIKMFEKPEKVLKVGLHYDNLFSVGITANLTMRNVLGENTRTIIAGDISENPRIRFDYLKYVGVKQKSALNIRYDYRLLQIPNYTNGKLQDIEINKNHIAGIGLMSTQSLKEFTFASFKYEFEGYKYKVGNSTPEGIKSIRTNRLLLTGGYIRNTHNDRNYPSKGTNLELVVNFFPWNNYNLKYASGTDTIYLPIDSIGTELTVTKPELDEEIKAITPDFFARLFFNYSKIIPLAKKFQIIPSATLGATLSTQEPRKTFDDFIIGGTLKVDPDDSPFYGLNYREFTAPNMAILGVFFQNIVFKNIFIRYGINGLVYNDYVPLDELDTFDFKTMINNNSILGYGFHIKYKSVIGPIGVALSYNNRDRYPRFYFSIGYSFNYQD